MGRSTNYTTAILALMATASLAFMIFGIPFVVAQTSPPTEFTSKDIFILGSVFLAVLLLLIVEIVAIFAARKRRRWVFYFLIVGCGLVTVFAVLSRSGVLPYIGAVIIGSAAYNYRRAIGASSQQTL